MKGTLLLATLAALTLLGCGKTEQAVVEPEPSVQGEVETAPPILPPTDLSGVAVAGAPTDPATAMADEPAPLPPSEIPPVPPAETSTPAAAAITVKPDAQPQKPDAAKPVPEATAVKPVAPTKAAAPAPSDKASPDKPAAEAPKADLARGQQIYRQSCAVCHDKGVAGAPKLGDSAVWAPRLAQGMDTLYSTALRGKGAMPAKGGNPALADDDVKSAVDFMAAQAR